MSGILCQGASCPTGIYPGHTCESGNLQEGTERRQRHKTYTREGRKEAKAPRGQIFMSTHTVKKHFLTCERCAAVLLEPRLFLAPQIGPRRLRPPAGPGFIQQRPKFTCSHKDAAVAPSSARVLQTLVRARRLLLCRSVCGWTECWYRRSLGHTEHFCGKPS